MYGVKELAKINESNIEFLLLFVNILLKDGIDYHNVVICSIWGGGS